MLAGKLVLAAGREPSCSLCPEANCNTREEHLDTLGEERRYKQPVEIVNDLVKLSTYRNAVDYIK